jgi:hypothetical protein
MEGSGKYDIEEHGMLTKTQKRTRLFLGKFSRLEI